MASSPQVGEAMTFGKQPELGLGMPWEGARGEATTIRSSVLGLRLGLSGGVTMAKETSGDNGSKLSKAEFALKAIAYLVKATPTIKAGGVETPRKSKGIHLVFTTDANGANFPALWRAYFGVPVQGEEMRADIDALIAAKVCSGHPTKGGFMLYKHGDDKGRKADIDPKKAQDSIAAMLK